MLHIAYLMRLLNPVFCMCLHCLLSLSSSTSQKLSEHCLAYHWSNPCDDHYHQSVYILPSFLQPCLCPFLYPSYFFLNHSKSSMLSALWLTGCVSRECATVGSDSTLRLVLQGSSDGQQIFSGHTWGDVTPAPPDFVSPAAVPNVFRLVAARNVIRQSFCCSHVWSVVNADPEACHHHNRRLLDTSFLGCWCLKMYLSYFYVHSSVILPNFCLELAFRVYPHVRLLYTQTRHLTRSHPWWCLLLPLLPLRSLWLLMSILFRSTIHSSLWTLLFYHLSVPNSRKFSTIIQHISFSLRVFRSSLLCLILFLMFLSLSWLWCPCSFLGLEIFLVLFPSFFWVKSLPR